MAVAAAARVAASVPTDVEDAETSTVSVSVPTEWIVTGEPSCVSKEGLASRVTEGPGRLSGIVPIQSSHIRSTALVSSATSFEPSGSTTYCPGSSMYEGTSAGGAPTYAT